MSPSSRPAYWSKRWQVLARRCKDRDGWRCRDCSGVGRLEAHHLQPVDQGGAMWDLDNLLTLCRDCHRARHRPAQQRRDPKWDRLIDNL